MPQKSAAVLVLSSFLGLTACTGSPATLAIPPDFEVMTPEGLASVSVREPAPELTDAAFERVVMTGMQAAMPGSMVTQPTTAPYPQRRIVWHVNPTPARGVSRLIVNVFDGSVPLAYEQDVVADSSPTSVITYKVTSLTKRLVARYAQLDVQAPT
jgi:hypothetical protein